MERDKRQFYDDSICRHLTNRSKTNQQHVSIESTSSSTSQFNYSPQVANLDLALAEVKVFQDEQIIQVMKWCRLLYSWV